MWCIANKYDMHDKIEGSIDVTFLQGHIVCDSVCVSWFRCSTHTGREITQPLSLIKLSGSWPALSAG